MAGSNEKICNEVICKLQKLTSLLVSVDESVQSISSFLSTHIERESSTGGSSTGGCAGVPTSGDQNEERHSSTIAAGVVFGSKSANLKNTMERISFSLDNVSKRLKTDMDTGFVSDLESSDLEYSDRLHLLYYASDYSPLPDIIGSFVLRYLPDISPFFTAISNGMIANITMSAFTMDTDELATDALSAVAGNELEYKQLLKEVDAVLVTHASDALQYCVYVTNTFSIVDRIL